MAGRGDFKDYYQILGVPPSASAEEIRFAYRQLARAFHPDLTRSNLFELQMKLINKAYSVLSDPRRKQRYDFVYDIYKGDMCWVVSWQPSPAPDREDPAYAGYPWPASQEPAAAWREPPGKNRTNKRKAAAPPPINGVIIGSIPALGFIFVSIVTGETIFADILTTLTLIGFVYFTAVEVLSWFGGRSSRAG